MNKHTVLIFLIALAPALIRAQQTEFIQIKDPIVDNKLTIPWYAGLLAPRYIVNNNYVIFQKYNYGGQRTRKILNADVKSFRFPRNGDDLFALDKNGVYFDGDFFETDTTGFKIVGYFTTIVSNRYKRNYFWKTKDKIFLNANEFKDVDVPSFQSIGYDYFKDKNSIYYQDRKIEGSDPNSASLGFRNEGVIRDKNYIYASGKILTHKGDTLRPVNNFLLKTSTEVLYNEGYVVNLKVQPDIDVETIKPLSRRYSMDKNFIYYINRKTPILPENFENVRIWDWEEAMFPFISDGINVYFGGEVFDAKTYGARQARLDAKTFGMIPSSGYFFDKNGIYGSIWDKEKGKVLDLKFPFSYTEEVSDKNTFLTITKVDGFGYGSYIIYKNQAYDLYEKKLYTNLTQKQIDLAKDNKLDIISINGKITEKKPFSPFWRLYEANNKVYYEGKETIADAQTLKWVTGSILFKDKRYVYKFLDFGNGLTPVRGVDLQTANKGFDGYFFADKDYIYWNDYRIIKNNKAELLAVFADPGEGGAENEHYYLLKNSEGYWLLSVDKDVRIRNLGNTLSGDIQKLLKE